MVTFLRSRYWLANYERRKEFLRLEHQFPEERQIRSIVLNASLWKIRIPSPTSSIPIREAERLGGALEGRFDFFNEFNENFVTAEGDRDPISFVGIILPRILQVGGRTPSIGTRGKRRRP